MRLKIIYKKNLKMTGGKIAAQAVHAAMGIGHIDPEMSIVVLGFSNKKYKQLLIDLIKKDKLHYEVHDAGYTEVNPNTNTCVAFFDK